MAGISCVTVTDSSKGFVMSAQQFWLLTYLESIPDGVPMSLTNVLEVHPDSASRSCIALRVPEDSLRLLGFKAPQPSSLVAMPGGFYEAVWLIRDPIPTPESGAANQRPYNCWRQVCCALVNILRGQLLTEKMINPFAAAEDEMRQGVSFPGETSGCTLWEIKGFWMQSDNAELKKIYKRSTWDSQTMARLGGRTRSAAQQQARRENVAKAMEAARVAAKERGHERAKEVLRLSSEGLTTVQLAEALHIAPSSVRKTVSRAQEVLGLRPDQFSLEVAKREVEVAAGFDELVNELSSSPAA